MAEGEKRIAIYSRKSRFTGKGESIGNQVELCRAYVRNTYGENAAECCTVFEDEGFSGRDLKRPDFQRMMDAVRSGQFKTIVVYRLDRVSRNISDFSGLIDELTRRGVAFVSIKEQFDTGTPMGRAMMFIISVFSQLERETIAERIRDNMHELAKTGRWLGGNTPVGFRSDSMSRVTIDGKVRKSFRLVPVPEETEIPGLIFDLYTEKDSLTAVETELLRRRIRTRQGKDYSRFAIRSILQNPVYMVADEPAYDYFLARGADISCPKTAFDGNCGIMAYNRTSQEKGKTTVLLPVSQWIIAPGKHMGMVSSGQWIRVQESLERNKAKGFRKPRSNEALLTGLIYCSCGGRMHPKLSPRRMDSGAISFSYVCTVKEKSKGERCNCRNVNGNAADAAVLEQIKSIPEDVQTFLACLAKNRGLFTDRQDQQERQLEEYRKEYARNEKNINGLMDSLGMADTSAVKSRILKRVEELSENNRNIDRCIRQLEKDRDAIVLMQEASDQTVRNLAGFRASVDHMSVAERRTAVREIMQKIIWDGNRIHGFLRCSEI